MSKRLGTGCLALAFACWVPSLALGGGRVAAWVVGFSFLEGAAFGALLALITRTRRPLFIYLALAAAGLTLWPLMVGWPPADRHDLHLWRNAPELFATYFDVARFVVFLLGVPYPFARWGHHASDLPLPTKTPLVAVETDKMDKSGET